MTVVAPSRDWMQRDPSRRDSTRRNPGATDPAIDVFLGTWSTAPSGEEVADLLARIDAVPIDELARRTEALAARYLLTLAPAGWDQRAAADRLAKCLPPQSTFAQGLDVRAYLTTAAALVLMLFRDGRLAQSAELARRSLERADGLSLAEFAAGRDALAWLRFVSGQTLLSLERMPEAIALLEAVERSDAPFPRFAASALLVTACALDGQIDRAIDRFDEVWALGEEIGWMADRYASAALTGLAIAEGALRHLDDQAETIELLRARAPGSSTWSVAADLIRIRLMLARGRVDRARDILAERFRPPGPADLEPIVRNLTRFTRAEVMLADGKPGFAIADLQSAPASPNHIGCRGSVTAFAYISLNLPVDAIAATEECVSLAHEHSLATLQNVFFARSAAFMLLDRREAAMRDLARGLLAASVGGFGIIEQLPLVVLEKLIREGQLRELVLPVQIVAAADRHANGIDECFARFGSLSARERDILPYLRSKESFESLAALLFISENTIKAHNHHICAKLGVAGREEAVALVERLGYFELPTIARPFGDTVRLRPDAEHE